MCAVQPGVCSFMLCVCVCVSIRRHRVRERVSTADREKGL